MAAKANPLDGSQRIKCASGNGLRPEVWERFTRRYNVARIVEFYAATEGNTNLFNNAGVVGAVGVVPWFARFIYPVKLAKFDEEKGELIRDLVTGATSSNRYVMHCSKDSWLKNQVAVMFARRAFVWPSFRPLQRVLSRGGRPGSGVNQGS